MGRILYLLLSNGAGVAGGQKMCVRHVETLRDLGFDAACYLSRGSSPPTWFEHAAPIEKTPQLRDGDILVIPDDSAMAMRQTPSLPLRKIVFSQNPYAFAATSFDLLDAWPAEQFPSFIAVSEPLKATIRRVYPQASVEVVPCFADERLFRPGHKRAEIAMAPRKRMLEAGAIHRLVRKLHPRHRPLTWNSVIDAREAEFAQVLARSSLYLSLSRLESVGMTTLEAMASGCVSAGFTGVGGRVYTTAENGFWVAEDDCEGAADALAAAADVVATGGPALQAYVEAGRETANLWSYRRFRAVLEETWMRLAPQMRRSSGPLPYP